MNEPKEKVGRSRCGRKPSGRVTLTTRPLAETAAIIRARAKAERKTPGEIIDEMFAPAILPRKVIFGLQFGDLCRCGGEALLTRPDAYGMVKSYRYFCRACGIGTELFSKLTDAIDAWNAMQKAPTSEPGPGQEPAPSEIQTGTETVSIVASNGDVTGAVLPVESSQ